MSKTINFSSLKRKEVKVLIYTENGEVITEYNQDKITKLQEKIENPVLIFNPNNKQQIEMQKIVSEISKDVFKEGKDIVVTAKDLIIKFLPLCSNIVLDLDEEKDSELIKEIINDPSNEFSAVIKEVGEIVKKISEDYVETIKAYAKLPKEQIEKMLKANESKLSEKEKRKMELEKQLKELEKEDNEIEEINK